MFREVLLWLLNSFQVREITEINATTKQCSSLKGGVKPWSVLFYYKQYLELGSEPIHPVALHDQHLNLFTSNLPFILLL